MKKDTSIVIKFYKFERYLYTHKMKKLSKLVYHFIQIVFGCTIPPTVNLFSGVNIPHFHGIVIHQDTIIGENTLIYQNVTIGGRNGKAGVTIGKNCIISAGSCILGKVTIGDNVKIGANAVVISDIPDNCTAVGIPAKIVKYSNGDKI